MATNHSFQQSLPLLYPDGFGPPKKFVYYGARRGFIKIGTSVSPARRGKELGLHIMAVEPGGIVREHERHRQFRGARLMGEWFLATPELLSHVAALAPPQKRRAA
jgi:hypothetical protein